MYFRESLAVAQGNGTAVTAAAATTLLPAQAKPVIKSNYFDRIGKQLVIEASGIISSLITTPGTARFDVRWGTTVIFDGLAVLLDSVAAHSSVGWKLKITLTCRAVGSAGNFHGIGEWVCEDILGVPASAPKGVLTALLPWATAPAVGANADLTAASIIDLFFTQTASTGSITLQQYEAYCPNAD